MNKVYGVIGNSDFIQIGNTQYNEMFLKNLYGDLDLAKKRLGDTKNETVFDITRILNNKRYLESINKQGEKNESIGQIVLDKINNMISSIKKINN